MYVALLHFVWKIKYLTIDFWFTLDTHSCVLGKSACWTRPSIPSLEPEQTFSQYTTLPPILLPCHSYYNSYFRLWSNNNCQYKSWWTPFTCVLPDFHVVSWRGCLVEVEGDKVAKPAVAVRTAFQCNPLDMFKETWENFQPCLWWQLSDILDGMSGHLQSCLWWPKHDVFLTLTKWNVFLTRT